MAQYRMLVTLEDPAAPTAIDYVVNTFYLDTDALSGADDPQALCEDAAALWATYRMSPNCHEGVRVRAYDMSDTVPRLPKGEFYTGLVGSTAPPGPREVALCLSYYAGKNVPRQRGRMYIGPWAEAALAERPTVITQNLLVTLAEGISGLGGVNVQWVQYSPTTQTYTNVTNYWIDDEWDTVRSRGLEGTSRVTGTVSG